MVEKHGEVVLRKVDIVDWNSAAARQAAKEFGLQGIPHVRVFDAKGKLVTDLSGPSPDAVDQAIHKALEQ